MVWCRAASVCVATLFSIHETTAWTFIGPGRYHSRAHRRHVPAPKSALLTGFSSRSCAKNPRVVVMSIINPDAKGGDNREEFVRVSLPKPLGIQLEEVRGGFPGLRVSAVVEGGSVIENGVRNDKSMRSVQHVCRTDSDVAKKCGRIVGHMSHVRAPYHVRAIVVVDVWHNVCYIRVGSAYLWDTITRSSINNYILCFRPLLAAERQFVAILQYCCSIRAWPGEDLAIW